MRLGTNFFISILLISCATFLIASYTKPPEKHKLPGITTLDSQAFNPKSLKGKVCIVSYFQTWCKDCVKEQPQLLQLQQRFGTDSLRILMISDEPVDKIRAFISKFDSKLEFYHTSTSLKKDFGVTAYPTTYLLDTKGRVRIKKIEGINWYTPEVITEISELLRK